MIIELAGTGTSNKGAELMAVAVREHFVKSHPTVKLAVRSDFGGFADRCRYEFNFLANENSLRWRGVLRLASKPMKELVGVVAESDVDAVVDASGFAFSDQLSFSRMERFLRDVRRWRKQGKKIVLLPQALGPFEKSESMDVMRDIFRNVDLVFARCADSMSFAEHLCRDASKILQVPDFTCLVKPLREGEIGCIPRVCIVPNQRMIEHANSDKDRVAYEQLMLDAVTMVRNYELEPVLFVHSKDDAKLVGKLHRRLGDDVQLMQETDPVRIKAELGKSRLVIGSRFHALVSALTQNVPAIATSWSHKYEMLFADYKCRELVLKTGERQKQLSKCIDLALGNNRNELVRGLGEVNEANLRETQKMWRLVDEVLGLDG